MAVRAYYYYRTLACTAVSIDIMHSGIFFSLSAFNSARFSSAPSRTLLVSFSRRRVFAALTTFRAAYRYESNNNHGVVHVRTAEPIRISYYTMIYINRTPVCTQWWPLY